MWWARPLIIFTCLTAFVIYVTWAAFQGVHYLRSYLSPLYSLNFLAIRHMLVWTQARLVAGILPWSPALVILWPRTFRLTCYYRGATKSFWADPPSCTVTEPRKYLGEIPFPLSYKIFTFFTSLCSLSFSLY